VDVRIVTRTPLLRGAAEVLAPVRNDVVVVGAAAIEAVLAETAMAAITPTRDVDVVVPTERVADIVSVLEAAEMRRSELPHERAFTWVRGDLKVQLVRTFHPFPRPPAKSLPVNAAFGMASRPAHQLGVAFPDAPDVVRLRCANAVCLLALKEAAFGRTRPTDDRPVERDYHDAFLLVSAAADQVVAAFASAGHEVRQRALRAVAALQDGGEPTAAAARQMVLLGDERTVRRAEAVVRRAAGEIRRRLLA